MKKNTTGTTEEVEVIEIVEDGERVYYRKPFSEKYRQYRVEKIPRRLFDLYRMRRDEYRHTRGIIKRYFHQLKDKPMYVAKNHVREGERHKFSDDGSVTVIKKMSSR